MKSYLTKIFLKALIIVVMSGILYFIFWVIGLLDLTGAGLYLLLLIICSIIFLLYTKPVIAYGQAFKNAVLYPGQEQFENEINGLSEKIMRSIKYKEIFGMILQDFSEIIKSKNIIIYHRHHNNILTRENDEKVTEELLQLIKNENDPLFNILNNVKKIEVFPIVEFKKLSSTLRDILFLLQIRSLITLVDKDEVIGWIAIGDIKRKKLSLPSTKATLIKFADKLTQAFEHAGLYQEAKRESVEKGILIEVVRKISTSKDLEEILSLIIDYLAEIVNYDAAGIFLVDKDSPRNLKYNVLRGYDEKEFEGISLKVGKGLVGWSVKYGKGVITGDVSKDERYIKLRKDTKSQMVIPIKSGGDVIGAFCLESNTLNFFTQDHYEFTKTFASQTALAIENAQLYFEFQQKQKMDEELKRARDIQSALLPEKIPDIQGYKIAVFHQYSKELGGDLHDVRKINETKVSLAIGDASGKGIPGAILMTALYGIFRTDRFKSMNVNETIQRLNNSLNELTRSDSYATFFYGILDVENGELVYTNAGHNQPVLIKKSREVQHLDIGGTVLGFFKEIEYKNGKVVIEDGDILCLYTDGVTEYKNKSDEEFGEKRLLEILLSSQQLSPEKIKNKVINKLNAFGGNDVYDDDVTLLIVKKEQDKKNNEDA